LRPAVTTAGRLSFGVIATKLNEQHQMTVNSKAFTAIAVYRLLPLTSKHV
jgi:hypothetical protein